MLINEIIHGDCLEEAAHIESGSVDLILTDLPYGTMNGFNGIGWDFAIDPKKIHQIANRILRRNGKMVLFGQEPYTSRLTVESLSELPFSYRMAWEKDNFANALLVNKAPVSFFEDILIFSKRGDYEYGGGNNLHPLKKIFNEALISSGKDKKFFIRVAGSSASHYFTDGFQFRIPSREKFDLINEHLKIEYTFEELVSINDDFKKVSIPTYTKKYPSTFNLWEGNKYKSNILRYKKDYNGYHPTQKPVLLLEDLIKTFSNEGDTVVDLTAGSGSTLVAAANTGRNFIGIEKELEYVNVANNRIAQI